MRHNFNYKRVSNLIAVLILSLIVFITSCNQSSPAAVIITIPSTKSVIPDTVAAKSETVEEKIQVTFQPPVSYSGTPTPNSANTSTPATPDPTQSVVHTVAPGETLTIIANKYGTTIDKLIANNNIANINILEVGQQVVIPALIPENIIIGPDYKIIPDSELVLGPAAKDFDVLVAVDSFGGFLKYFKEEVEGRVMSGTEIVNLISHRFSVNPRLLLAALEYRSGWVTKESGVEQEFPMGYINPHYKGLYKQLAWATNLINKGYYGRSEGGMRFVNIDDGTSIAFSDQINDGTAGIHNWLASNEGATYESWLQETGPAGFATTFNTLFGNAFGYTVDPLWPDELIQPEMTLPWQPGETWYITSGPHGGWDSGSGWAALDFIPPTDLLGCYESESWVVAVAPGVVTRSDLGAVVVDNDSDGYAGTGWAVTYMHLDTRDRAPVGSSVNTGDKLGHPSCEGGFSNGTHLHISRTYNGRWVSADGPIPFNMDGWISEGYGREYDGHLIKGDQIREACGTCREPWNAITAE